MKRVFAGILFYVVFIASSLRAADAVALAAQQEAEERYKNLIARIDEMQSAQLALEKRISALASDFSKLRDEVARDNTSEATKESIRRLNEQILKVDESRVADNRRIHEALEKLGSTLKNIPAAAPRTRTETPARPATNTSPAVQDGFEYSVLSGDYLGKIVARLREEKIMVTSKSIQDANPAVDWNRLQVGQRIFIPKPK